MSNRLAPVILALAMVLLAVATALGAYASHAAALAPAALESLKTGIDFQFFHALGLLGLALVLERRADGRVLVLGTLAVAVGVVLFCGGVYASSLGGPRVIARLAPVGGVALIIGWLVCAAGLLTARRMPP